MVCVMDQTANHAEMHVATGSKSTFGTGREAQDCKEDGNTEIEPVVHVWLFMQKLQ